MVDIGRLHVETLDPGTTPPDPVSKNTPNIIKNTYLEESVCVARCPKILQSTDVNNLHKAACEEYL